RGYARPGAHTQHRRGRHHDRANGRPLMRALLRDRSYRRLLIGQTLSAFGDYAMFLALAVWVKVLTGSNATAGLAILPFVLPSLAGPALGVYVDRFPRRRIMIGTDLAAAASLLPL